jgi:hypothetical protein
MLLFTIAGCVAGNSELQKSPRIACEGVVTAIEARKWVATFGGIESGDSVLVLKVMAPSKYAGRALSLGLHSRKELNVGGGSLVAGTRISFTANEPLLEGEDVIPQVFTVQVSDVRIL